MHKGDVSTWSIVRQQTDVYMSTLTTNILANNGCTVSHVEYGAVYYCGTHSVDGHYSLRGC